MRLIGECLAIAYIVTVVVYMVEVYPAMSLHRTEYYLYQVNAEKEHEQIKADLLSVQDVADYQNKFEVTALCSGCCNTSMCLLSTQGPYY